MFQRKTSKGGVVRSGLVAAAVMTVLLPLFSSLASDVLTYTMSIDIDQTMLMVLSALFYFFAGFYLAGRGDNPTGVALSASFWIMGLGIFWLLYHNFLFPFFHEEVMQTTGLIDNLLSSLSYSALAFVSVIGARLGKLK